jgi:O-antigen/teichoic acid export membrane protein
MISVERKAIYLYIITGLFRFFTSFITFYIILRSLSTFEYAQYGLLVSLSAIFTLVIGANTASVFEKLYSYQSLYKDVNGSLVLLYTVLGLTFFVIIVIIQYIISIFFADSQIAKVLNNNYIFVFFLLNAISITSMSLVNALKRYLDFAYLTIAPSILIFLGIVNSPVVTLANIIVILCVSHGLTFFLYIIYNIGDILKIRISFKKSPRLIRYIIAYCRYSILTILSKHFLDLTLRTLLMERFGYISLASYNLASSFMGIFKEIAENIMMAITPYFLESRSDQKQKIRNAIIAMRLQIGILIIILSTAIFWYDLLSFIFPEKDKEIFDVRYVLYAGSIILISYYENYIIMFLKQSWITISKLYILTFIFNMLCIILVFQFGRTVDLSLIFVTFCSLFNCYFVHTLKRKYFGKS